MKSQDDKKFIWFLIIITFILAGFIACVRLAHAETTENGKLNLNLLYETQGQKNWFVTASGTGDCSSWDKACTFRTAVTKCTDDVQDVIWMSPEDHDTDNGSDGTGTDITAKNVRVIGSGITHQFSTRFFNGHATASIVITASGHRSTFENLRFTQEGKTDVDVTYLNITGSRGVVYYSDFRSATGATSDVAILYNGSSQYHYSFHNHFRDFTDAAIRTNASDHIEMTEMFFEACTIGMDFTHADDGPFKITDASFKGCTTGMAVAAGVESLTFYDPVFIHCTTNIGSTGDYDVLHLIGFYTGHALIGTYPVGAGVLVTGAAGAWTQGALTEIIPPDTITTPFFLNGLNIQSSSATDSYQIEIFYGESSASNVSLGIFEFVSDRKTGVTLSGLNALAIPADSYVGIKLESASGGSDTATLTLSYLAVN